MPHRALPRLALGTALLLAAAGIVQAQAGWEDELAAEIDLEHGCRIAYLSHIVERVVEGKRLVMAKAHCEDERVFDAMRPDEFAPFQLRECEPATARAC